MPVLAVGPRKMRHPGAFSEFGKIHGGEITAYVGLPDYLEERVPTREALSKIWWSLSFQASDCFMLTFVIFHSCQDAKRRWT